MVTKICTKCKVNKQITKFGKDNSSQDRLQHWCTTCQKEYRHLHKEKISIYSRKYRDSHKQERRKKAKFCSQVRKQERIIYLETNKEKIKEKVTKQQRIYYLLHREEIKLRSKKWAELNKQHKAENAKIYYQTHKEEIKKRHKKYYCKVCGEEIHYTTAFYGKGRCVFCANQRNRKPNNKCIDCDKELTNCYAKRCSVCAKIKHGKYANKNNCIDCGKQIPPSLAKRCKNCWHVFSKGKNHWNWQGGISSLYEVIRHLPEYKQWRFEVFKRDIFTCQECNYKGKKIESHHKESFSYIYNDFLKLYDQFSPIDDKKSLVKLAKKYKPFWEVSNGQTLCKPCHNVKTKEHKNAKK